MKTSELIRAAIPLMRTTTRGPGSVGLCVAMERTAGRAELRAYAAARERVQSALGPYAWASSWLMAQGIPEHELVCGGYVMDPTVAMQTWRREWAERLAAEFEAEGD